MKAGKLKEGKTRRLRRSVGKEETADRERSWRRGKEEMAGRIRSWGRVKEEKEDRLRS